MISWYQQLLRDHRLQADAQQAAAVELLADFGNSLQSAERENRWKPKFRQWWGGKPAVKKQGIYLHGGVGRGKSFLMDGFFLHLPLQKKLRVHFHQFMRRLHSDMKANEKTRDPLAQVANTIIEKYQLICFDEFHISDITDAMILGRLLDILLGGGVQFIMTSNYPPRALYPNGLARDRFLPAIALLEQRLHIVSLDGDKDYRRQALADQPIYFTPWREAHCQQAMRDLFNQLACGISLQNDFKLNGRRTEAVARTSDCIWFDFDTLCQQPRAQADYLQLAQRFATIFLSAVPALDCENTAEASRRFTWLVDILYDARVRLVLGAEVALAQLYGKKEGGESGRTLSRLLEMQSSAYATEEKRVQPFVVA